MTDFLSLSRTYISVYLKREKGPGGGGGGTPHMKGMGMLVVSLRGVNFEFWSHLGCSGPVIGLV